jgi:hypothetical protein
MRGVGFTGPGFRGCGGTRITIWHLNDGRYAVGPEHNCRVVQRYPHTIYPDVVVYATKRQAAKNFLRRCRQYLLDNKQAYKTAKRAKTLKYWMGK